MRRDRNQAALQELQEELAQKAEAEGKAQATLSPEQIAAYTTQGGTPHLDGAYTVFGEVVAGLEVVEAIQNAPTNRADRPQTDIQILGIEEE